MTAPLSESATLFCLSSAAGQAENALKWGKTHGTINAISFGEEKGKDRSLALTEINILHSFNENNLTRFIVPNQRISTPTSSAARRLAQSENRQIRILLAHFENSVIYPL